MCLVKTGARFCLFYKSASNSFERIHILEDCDLNKNGIVLTLCKSSSLHIQV